MDLDVHFRRRLTLAVAECQQPNCFKQKHVCPKMVWVGGPVLRIGLVVQKRGTVSASAAVFPFVSPLNSAWLKTGPSGEELDAALDARDFLEPSRQRLASGVREVPEGSLGGRNRLIFTSI